MPSNAKASESPLTITLPIRLSPLHSNPVGAHPDEAIHWKQSSWTNKHQPWKQKPGALELKETRRYIRHRLESVSPLAHLDSSEDDVAGRSDRPVRWRSERDVANTLCSQSHVSMLPKSMAASRAHTKHVSHGNSTQALPHGKPAYGKRRVQHQSLVNRKPSGQQSQPMSPQDLSKSPSPILALDLDNGPARRGQPAVKASGSSTTAGVAMHRHLLRHSSLIEPNSTPPPPSSRRVSFGAPEIVQPQRRFQSSPTVPPTSHPTPLNSPTLRNRRPTALNTSKANAHARPDITICTSRALSLIHISEPTIPY